ncbi:unnamed protein product [Caenorhabditis auriculariae]|uniref:Uncharacterized protein n=1 Tax=Caenorhabditis auriculariae TaxID=2777116 RepID=A0A8S1H2N8_9PELO|nr:unnamed protein product [Caenorhabditis auriculariae]
MPTDNQPEKNGKNRLSRKRCSLGGLDLEVKRVALTKMHSLPEVRERFEHYEDRIPHERPRFFVPLLRDMMSRIMIKGVFLELLMRRVDPGRPEVFN